MTESTMTDFIGCENKYKFFLNDSVFTRDYEPLENGLISLIPKRRQKNFNGDLNDISNYNKMNIVLFTKSMYDNIILTTLEDTLSTL